MNASAKQHKIIINAFIFDGFEINAAKVSSIEKLKKHRLVFISIAAISAHDCQIICFSYRINFMSPALTQPSLFMMKWKKRLRIAGAMKYRPMISARRIPWSVVEAIVSQHPSGPTRPAVPIPKPAELLVILSRPSISEQNRPIARYSPSEVYPALSETNIHAADSEC